MWIANYSVTPLQSTQNRTHTPLHSPGLSGPMGGQHLSRFPPAAQAHPPARLREPRAPGLLDGSAPLSPHCRSPDTPHPLHTRQQPTAGLPAASACRSTGRHCPALGAQVGSAPSACPGASQSPPRVPGKTRDILFNQRGCPLLRAPGGLREPSHRDAWTCLWGLTSDPPRSKAASPVTPATGPATQRRLL